MIQFEGFIREIVLLKKKVESFKNFPFSIPAIQAIDRLPLDPKVTIFVGENGSGKSTLIEALAMAVGLNPEGGSKNFSFAERPTESTLHEFLRVVRNPKREKSSFFLRAETLFNVSTEVERSGLWEYGWEDLHSKSHGEAFLFLIEKRFFPNGLYIMDEPESALSPFRQLMFLKYMNRLVQRGAQFILSTHSPILMAYPKALIYQLDSEGIQKIEYKETEHYQITRSFLEYPEMSLEELFKDPVRTEDANSE